MLSAAEYQRFGANLAQPVLPGLRLLIHLELCNDSGKVKDGRWCMYL
jgi:hypothetical protein